MASETGPSDSRDFILDETSPLPPELYPDIDHIVTEDDSALDNVFSEKQQRLLTEPLYSSWRAICSDAPNFVAMANVGMFFAIHQPPFVPDILLSLDVELPASLWPKRHRSYFIWEYGKPPDVVIEIVSNREDAEKFAGYARVGVKYYVIFDPQHYLSDTTLRSFQLSAMNYQPMELPIRFDGTELGLKSWTGKYEGREEEWLRWIGQDGGLIPTGAERADQEQTRADRLAQQLRNLGHDPEA